MKKWCVLIASLFILGSVLCEIKSGRQRADDEPQIIGGSFLEGIIEPFESTQEKIPAWKIMKNTADSKVASHKYQDALKVYSQILKRSNLFGQMPKSERYDTFLSMAKLLKIMGFHERSELLLYEAIIHSSSPFEAHFQLGLLFLEKEDLNNAKIQFKNCLYYKETDPSTLIHLTVILLSEGKSHEAKFYITHILSGMNKKLLRLNGLSEVDPVEAAALPGSLSVPRTTGGTPQGSSTDPLSSLSSRVSHAHLSYWLEELMVKVLHGNYHIPYVSVQSISDNFKMFSNLYDWLVDGEMTGRFVFDLGQSLYEVGKASVGLDMMRRGQSTSNISAEGEVSIEIVKMRLALEFPVVPTSVVHIIDCYLNMTMFLAQSSETYSRIELDNILDVYWPIPMLPFSGMLMGPVVKELLDRFRPLNEVKESHRRLWFDKIPSVDKDSSMSQGSAAPKVSIGIFGGHLNYHSVGLSILYRVVDELAPHCHLTLVALPLFLDDVTRKIAAKVHRIINLPMNSTSYGRQLLEQELNVDILLFPDWQPFPDQHALLYQSLRLAPIQICLYILGHSCGNSDTLDYYLLPEDVQGSYLKLTSSRRYQATFPPMMKHSKNVGTGSTGSPPLWLEPFQEQVVLLNWPVFSAKTISLAVPKEMHNKLGGTQHSHSDEGDGFDADAPELSTARKPTASIAYTQPHTEEEEGPIFFDGQPVAMMAIYPSMLHPLMDDTIIKILRTTSSLQLVLVLPEIHFDHASNVPAKYRISWARMLVRRLWAKAGSGGRVANRIRLLPSPVSNARLLHLFEKADMVLDTYPYGTSLHTLALALSVGTPVVTMASGVVLETPQVDLQGIRHHMLQLASTGIDHEWRKKSISGTTGSEEYDHGQRTDEPSGHIHANTKATILESNPLYQYVLRHDIPWVPCSCPVAVFYKELGLTSTSSSASGASYSSSTGSSSATSSSTLLVPIASSEYEYEVMATYLASNRDAAYTLRNAILDSMDRHTQDTKQEEAGEKEGKEATNMSELARFMLNVGKPWAELRGLLQVGPKSKVPTKGKGMRSEGTKASGKSDIVIPGLKLPGASDKAGSNKRHNKGNYNNAQHAGAQSVEEKKDWMQSLLGYVRNAVQWPIGL